MRRKQTPQLVQEAQKLVNGGMTVDSACKKVKISVASFYKYGGKARRLAMLPTPAAAVLPNQDLVDSVLSDDTDEDEEANWEFLSDSSEMDALIAEDIINNELLQKDKVAPVEVSTETKIKLGTAKSMIFKKYPFYLPVVDRMATIWTDEVDLVGCDQRLNFYVNPSWVDESDMKTLAFACLHEVNHVVREHFSRERGRNRKLWNTATDLEIHSDFLGSVEGIEEIENTGIYCFPKKFDLPKGLSAEEYYRRLGERNLGSQSSGAPAAGSGESGDGNSEQDSSEGQTASQDSGEGGQGGGQCSQDDDETNQGEGGGSSSQSCQDPQSSHSGDDQSGQSSQGDQGEGEDQSSSQSGGDGQSHNTHTGLPSSPCNHFDVNTKKMQDIANQNDMANTDTSQAEKAIQAVFEQIEEQSASNKGCGNIPAGLRRELARRKDARNRRLHEEKNRWKNSLSVVLKRNMSMSRGTYHATYAPPARWWNSRKTGVFLPSLRSPEAKVSVVLDTSGSMGSEEIQQSLKEIAGIIKVATPSNTGVKVHCCDWEAYDTQTVKDAFDVEIIGGGGTDMRKGLEAAADDGSHVTVVITDGFTPWPKKPVARTGRTVVCVVSDDGDGPKGPDWASTIQVKT